MRISRASRKFFIMIFRIFSSRFHCLQDKRAWNSIPNFSVVLYHVVTYILLFTNPIHIHSLLLFNCSQRNIQINKLQLVLCQSEYFSLKIKSKFGNCATYQTRYLPITFAITLKKALFELWISFLLFYQ